MSTDTWAGARNILAIRLDNIGDVVMTGPALRALRQALPAARITAMVSPAGAQVAPLLPEVDDIVVHRAVWQDASWSMPLDPAREQALVDDLRARAFDAAVIFTSFSQSPYPPASVCYLAGIPLRLGQSAEFGGSILSHWVKPLPHATHQVDRNLHLVESLGLPAAGRQLALRVPAAARGTAMGLLRQVGVDPESPYMVLAPGASCAARRYDPERYAQVAHLLVSQTGWPIIVVGSERETALAAPITGGAGKRIVSLVGRTSIPELVAVIERAALVVANDSGPMHLADATGRPMVILFSGTELEEQWQPRGAPARLLRQPTACSPCYLFRCPYAMECLDIAPDEVVGVCLALLAEAGPTHALSSVGAARPVFT